MSTQTRLPLPRPASKLTAEKIKEALRRRHPALWPGTNATPGAWTCLEEFMNVDLLAFGVWAGAKRIGYEVKVSRSDYRRELVTPSKRWRAISFCHQFYFAVPVNLLDEEELEWTEPEGFNPAQGVRREWEFEACECKPQQMVAAGRNVDGSERQVCGDCLGRGKTQRLVTRRDENAALRDAPYLWVPPDMGLVIVEPWGEGTRCRVLKEAPLLRPTYELGQRQLGELVRWASARPDPRHRPQP